MAEMTIPVQAGAQNCQFNFKQSETNPPVIIRRLTQRITTTAGSTFLAANSSDYEDLSVVFASQTPAGYYIEGFTDASIDGLSGEVLSGKQSYSVRAYFHNESDEAVTIPGDHIDVSATIIFARGDVLPQNV